jgi:DNA-binding NarL/FixJ family response regulator
MNLTASVSGEGDSRLRVVLIEDQSLFADVIRAAVEEAGLDVVAVCATGAEGLDAVRALEPDLVLLDLLLPDQYGLEIGMAILERMPGMKVVALSVDDDPATVRRAMRGGFAGYLTKDTSSEGFIAALTAIMEGKAVFRHRLVSSRRPALPQDRDAALLVGQLTDREREVLALIARGVESRAIAETLGVKLNTVRSHVQAILMKLQVHSRLEAAAFAIQHGLAEPSEAAFRESPTWNHLYT